MRAIIIDDEPAARDDLRRLLSAHSEVAIVGEAGRFAAAEELLREADYDLVLLDVELRGGTGFDLVASVRPEKRIIFVTAHSQYAVRAFEINALDYLVKPIAAARLAVALRRATTTSDPQVPAIHRFTAGDLVHLKIGNGTTRFVALADIVSVESEENYSTVRLSDGTRHVVRRTLKAWTEALPPAQFVRVHRTAIVNLARYRGSDRPTERMTLIQLDGLSEPVRVSFRCLPELCLRLAAVGQKL